MVSSSGRPAPSVTPQARGSGDAGRRLAVQNGHVLMTEASGKRVVVFLQPDELGFQVANTLLKTAHLGDHAGIGSDDVAE
jgi:hypothetical protein